MVRIKVIKVLCVLGIVGGLFLGRGGGIAFSIIFAVIGGWLLMGIPNYWEEIDFFEDAMELLGCLGLIIIPLVFVFYITIFCPFVSLMDWIDNAKDKKIEKLRKQAESGDVEVQYKLGVLLMEKWEYYEAQNWFKKAVAQGHKDAQAKIDECLEIAANREKWRKEEEKRERLEEARPKCAYCGKKIPEDMKYGAVVETSQGPRFYCCRICKVNDGYGGQGY